MEQEQTVELEEHTASVRWSVEGESIIVAVEPSEVEGDVGRVKFDPR